MPRPTRLRRLAHLQAPNGIADGAGGTLADWITIGTHWVALQPVSGVETHEASRDSARITHRILLRCPRSLRPRADQRFRIGPRIFDIRAVFDRDGRGRFLTCLVEEGGPVA